jgi:hypothetical protein
MNPKQNEETRKKFEVILRQYIIGMQKPVMVQNALHCLFTDILLDIQQNQKITAVNYDFNKLISEFVEFKI